MGLDVYLYRYNGERTIAMDLQELKEHGNAIEDADGEAKQKYIDDNKLHLHVNKYGGPAIKEEGVELDSAKYPEHMFKIGYLRSSYNNSGFDSMLSQLCNYDLGTIFNYDGDYMFIPDWDKSLVRCDAMIDQLKCNNGYVVYPISPFNGIPTTMNHNCHKEADSLRQYNSIMEENHKDEPFETNEFQIWPKGTTLLAVVSGSNTILMRDESDEYYVYKPLDRREVTHAISVFESKKEQAGKESFRSFGCREGEFYLDGIEVFGLKKCNGLFGKRFDFIVRKDIDWYLQAAEITKEMIVWVLDQPDSDRYYLHWSG